MANENGRRVARLLIDNEVETSLEDFIAANETLTADDIEELKDLEIGDSMLLGFEHVARTA